MNSTRTLFYHITVFILAQIAWFSLLGLWIYWYVTNYIIFTQVGDKLSPQIISDNTNLFALVSGIILLVLVSIGMSIIFIYLNKQLSLTRLYDNFISNVTHELKSPLSSIQLYLETLNTRSVEDNKRRQFINLMLKDINRLNSLINSILYISGLEQRRNVYKYPHDYQVYIAGDILHELVGSASYRAQIPHQNVHLSGTAPCQCVIDKNWLGIVFDNLFDNAVKYSKGLADVSIKLSYTHKQILCVVSDKGIGIALKDQKKLFDKFVRIDNPDNPNVKGTGLGLYWAREIIKYHGGKIRVSSPGPGMGTSFFIELPVYQATKKRYIRNLLKRSKKESDNADE